MNTKNAFIIALFGAVIGCVATQLAQVYTASAQVPPRPFRECAGLSLEGSGDLQRMASRASSIAGWTPVGGWGRSGDYGVVLYR